MNYSHFHRLRTMAIPASAFPCLIVSILLFVLIFPGLPKSLAARETRPARTNNQQESPAITFAAIYRQTNLVSNLPGVALVEDRTLLEPWGVALNSSSPFWVVSNKNDRANLYRGDVSGSPLVSDSALPSVAIPNV